MSLPLLVCGIVIPVAVIIFICVAAWNKRIGAQLAFTLGVMGVMTGIVVANLPNIVGLVLKSGEKSAYGLELQRASQQVQADVSEVRQIKEQVEALAKRVKQGEQNVTAMHDNVQHAYQSLFQALGYVVLTRHRFPPPTNILKEMERHINLLAEFAYPNPQERAAIIQKMMESAKDAQPQIPQPK